MSATKQDKRNYRLRIFAYIKELGPIARVEDQYGKPGPLEETVRFFNRYDFEPISARDWAYACRELGIASDICQKPSTLKEGAVHMPRPEPKIILVKETPVFEHHEYAAHAHAAKLEFPVTKKLEEVYINKINSKDSSVLELSKTETIKTKHFASNKAMRYLFQDQVENIGLLFDRYEIHEATLFVEPLEDVQKQKRAYVTRVWYGGVPASHAILSFAERNLHEKNLLIWGTKIPEKNKIPKKF